MATFSATVKGWSEKAKRNAGLVVKASAQEVFERATRRQPSVKETGGAFEVGKVPVDTGELINSFQARLNDLTQGGAANYEGVILGMELGDTVSGVFTAKHARPIEYGVTGKFAGRFYVREAVQDWQTIVATQAARVNRLSLSGLCRMHPEQTWCCQMAQVRACLAMSCRFRVAVKGPLP